MGEHKKLSAIPPAGSASRARRNGPFDPRTVGRAAHEVIGQLCVDGLRGPDYERVMKEARQHPVTQQPTVRRQAAVTWLASVACSYLRWFVPPAGWSLVGVEVRGPSSRLDIVWRNEFDHSVVADELKTGKNPELVLTDDVFGQVDRQVADGTALYGRRFEAVRLLVLSAPMRSFVQDHEGVRSPLFGAPS